MHALWRSEDTAMASRTQWTENALQRLWCQVASSSFLLFHPLLRAARGAASGRGRGRGRTRRYNPH